MSARADALKAEISRRAAEFDPASLLLLLTYLGYRSEEILFQSSIREVSQPALVHRVEFRADPVKQAIVTLNIGLFGPQSPLPSYFKRLVDDANLDEQSFTDFVRFFDHKLLEGWVRSIYPEHDRAVFRDFEKTKESYLRLLGIGSVSTVHWLVELAYPELEVMVEKGTIMRSVRLEGARLGFCDLGGGAVLGGWLRAPVPGFLITLYSDDEHTESGRPWAEEVMRRLERLIFPTLAEAAVELKVILVIRT